MPKGDNPANRLHISDIAEKIREIQPDTKLLSTEYINNRQQLKFLCSCGKEFYKTWSTIQQKKSCQCRHCTYKRAWDNGDRRGAEIEEIKNKWIDDFNSFGLYPLEDIDNTRDKILCKDKNGYIGKISLQNAKKGKTFSKFSTKFNLENLIYNLNNYARLTKISTTVLSYDIYDRSCDTKIVCKCSCGKEYETSVANFTTQHKWFCGECTHIKSSLEIKTETELERLNVRYVAQKRFDRCRNPENGYMLPFDYYLPDYNMCIEVDGEQHYFPAKFGNETQ